MITQEDCDELTQHLDLLRGMADDPAEFQQMFGGALANFLGPISESDWAQLMSESQRPCGERGCTCHIQKQDLFESLDNLRKDWQQYNLQ